MFIKLTKFGTNMNKRYYFGFVYGSIPHGEWKPHSKYPWWKRWRVSFNRNLTNL